MGGETSAVVIIATIGNETLSRSIMSVVRQTFKNTHCIVVVDGPKFADRAAHFLEAFADHPRVQRVLLPQNTGSNGYVCHRIYAAMPLLVNEDYVFFLDDDNWFDEDHVESLVTLCERESLDWAYGLRRIIGADGQAICDDECESLGRWPVWYNDGVHHVDTNCYCLRRQVAVDSSRVWHCSRLDANGKVLPSADTLLCGWLLQHRPNVATNGRCTVNYALGSWALSPKPEFFLTGNARYRQRYPDGLPWRCEDAKPSPS